MTTDHQEELLPCWACGFMPVKGRQFRDGGSVSCSNPRCYVFKLAFHAEDWNTRSAALPVEGELRPCPCGSRAQVALTEELFHVECDDHTCCLALGTVVKYPYREAAIHAWNRLTRSAPVVPQPAAEKWRAIETAPKHDGPSFLVWCPMGRWGNVYQVFRYENDDRFRIYASGGRLLNERPSLWMPLPSPPNSISPAAVAPQRCNFCGESKPDLIPATSGFICKDCVAVCASMVEKPVVPVLPDEEMIEKLAALSHEQWSQWMRYMFEQCAYDGNLVSIPANCFHRWQRQMRTPYAKLPESEKESDRIEARKVLSLLPVP